MDLRIQQQDPFLPRREDPRRKIPGGIEERHPQKRGGDREGVHAGGRPEVDVRFPDRPGRRPVPAACEVCGQEGKNRLLLRQDESLREGRRRHADGGPCA